MARRDSPPVLDITEPVMEEEDSPEQLLTYFRARQKEMPGERAWEEGVRLTIRWIALLGNGPVPQAKFDALMNEIETSPDKVPGSGWFDLWLRVRHWGYQAGLSVPNDHPWRIPPNTFRCTAQGSFNEQLTPGKTYAAVARNSDRALIRILDDRGTTRWYPTSCFEEIVPPARTRVRKDVI